MFQILSIDIVCALEEETEFGDKVMKTVSLSLSVNVFGNMAVVAVLAPSASETISSSIQFEYAEGWHLVGGSSITISGII